MWKIRGYLIKFELSIFVMFSGPVDKVAAFWEIEFYASNPASTNKYIFVSKSFFYKVYYKATAFLPDTFPYFNYFSIRDSLRMQRLFLQIKRQRNLYVIWEKWRDLTQFYYKSPYTHRKIKKLTWQHKKRQQKLWLRNDCGPT